MPNTCADTHKDGDETGVDCGGSCNPCASGVACNLNIECASGICTNHACATATCGDGVKNGTETGVDCGGSCGPCDESGICNVNSDCASGLLCTNHICAVPDPTNLCLSTGSGTSYHPPVVCSPISGCVAGVCDPIDGSCYGSPFPDGTTCAATDPNASGAGACATGVCAPTACASGYDLVSGACVAAAPPGYCGGLGKLGAPFLICNAAAFEYMATSGDAFFQHGRTSPLWTPVSFKQTASFTLDSSWYPFEMDNVIYDGNGYTITYNLSSYPSSAPRGYLGLPDNVGLFSSLNFGATIKNLNIVGTITGAGTNAGLLAGAVNNDNATPVTVTHVRASGTVSSYFNSGGLIGTVYSGGGGDYSEISANATVIGTASGGDEGDNSVGGLIGSMQSYGTPDLRLEDCAASGSISVIGGLVGGIVGEGIDLDLRRCVSTSSLPSFSWAGGLLGQDDFGSNTNSDSHWSLGSAAASGFGTDGSGTSGESLPALLDGVNAATNYPGWDFTTVWLPPNGTNAATLR